MTNSFVKSLGVCLISVGINACDGKKIIREVDTNSSDTFPKRHSPGTGGAGRDSTTTMDQLRRRLGADATLGKINYDSFQALKDLALSNPSIVLKAYGEDPAAMNFEGFGEIAKLLAVNHPDLITDWLKNDLSNQVNDPNNRATFATFLLSALAETNPVAALDAFDVLSKTEFKEQRVKDALWESMLFRMGKNDANGAVREITKRCDGQHLSAALSAIAGGLAMKDISGALGILAQIPSVRERSEGIAKVLGSIGVRDYDRVAPSIAKMEGKDLMALLESDRTRSFETALYKNDLGAVERALVTVVLTDKNSTLFASYVGLQAAKDPAAALEFAMSYPESPLRNSLLVGSLFATWSQSDFDGAFAKAMDLGGAAKESAIRSVAMAAGLKGIDFVTATSQQLDKSSRNRFVTEAIGNASNADLAGSLAYVNSGRYLADASEERSRASVVETVAHNYTTKDPVAAFQWIQSLNGEAQTQAMHAYATESVNVDIRSFSEKLAGMPHDVLWRVGVGVLVSGLQRSDPASANQWQEALKEK